MYCAVLCCAFFCMEGSVGLLCVYVYRVRFGFVGFFSTFSAMGWFRKMKGMVYMFVEGGKEERKLGFLISFTSVFLSQSQCPFPPPQPPSPTTIRRREKTIQKKEEDGKLEEKGRLIESTDWGLENLLLSLSVDARCPVQYTYYTTTPYSPPVIYTVKSLHSKSKR